jgi:hypothetical protein
MVMSHAARGGSVGIAPPVGAAVLLVRDGRAGRVVAWSQGGLLCRVRLDGGADAGATVECAGCELRPLPAAEARAEPARPPAMPEPPREGAAPRSPGGLRPAAAILRLVSPAPAPPEPDRPAPRQEPAAGRAAGGRGRWEILPIRARR